MTTHQKTGKWGEQKALYHLRQHHYEILETNWRHKRAEVDIIARKDGILVFIEVKTRTNLSFGEPHDFVDQLKEDLMVDAAAAYMEKICHHWEIRFDIISITIPNEHTYKLRHIEDAFFPEVMTEE